MSAPFVGQQREPMMDVPKSVQSFWDTYPA
jgi:hypothetical protein